MDIKTMQRMVSEDNLKYLNARVADAAWSALLHMVRFKAEKAGGVYVEVEANAAQECSGCGEVVHKDLSVRVHSCPYCGLTVPRGVNAARNAKKRAVLVLRGGDRVADPEEPRPPVFDDRARASTTVVCRARFVGSGDATS